MPPVGIVVDLLSGVAFVALAAFVAAVGWRRGENQLFAAFGGGIGVHFIALNAALLPSGRAPWEGALLSLSAVGGAVAAGALIGLAQRAPWRIEPAERAPLGRWRLLPGGLAATYVLSFALSVPAWFELLAAEGRLLDVVGVTGAGAGPVGAILLGQIPVRAAMLYVGALLALRYEAAGDDDHGRRRQLGILFVALTLYPLLNAGADVGFLRSGLSLLPVLTGFLASAVLATLWLRASRGPGSRFARNLAWVSLIVPLVGMGAVVLAQGEVVTESGLMGLSRMAGVGVLAYAILRHQLLGIDVKVRWGLSRSTVAAVFLAVFFIVSEAAQEFFGETLGSGYVGILAAGALVFAIAPLSRVADRLAEKAVPVIPAPPGDAAERRGLYRRQLAAAYADGNVTPDERRLLAVAADSLGLTAQDALEIELEVLKGSSP